MTPMTSDDQLERWLFDNEITDMALRGIARAAWQAALASHVPIEAAAQPTEEPDGYCSKAPTAPHPRYENCVDWTPEIEHNDH